MACELQLLAPELILTVTVPWLLKPLERVNRAVWASISETLVARAGPTGLRPLPTRIRSLAWRDFTSTF